MNKPCGCIGKCDGTQFDCEKTCANCGKEYVPEEETYPYDEFCCTHCYNQYKGEGCEGEECKNCKDNEVD